jgi:hypothetical protein
LIPSSFSSFCRMTSIPGDVIAKKFIPRKGTPLSICFCDR